MAITPVNVGRVSLNMQSNLLVQGMQRSLTDLLREQERLSTGERILRPSDDPIEATGVIRMDEMLSAQQQYLANIDHASKVMNIADSTINSMYSLLNQAHSQIGLDNVQDQLATPTQRESASALVESILGQMVTLGNTEYLGSYIFAGRANTTPPFEKTMNGIQFRGDQTSIRVQVAPDISEEISLTAENVFGTGKGAIRGYQDLTPAADATTRLTDLNGGLGQGIRPGTIAITGSVIGQVTVDTTGCASMGDLILKINQTLPASVQVALAADGRRLELTSTNAGEMLRVTETGQGTTAHDLGLYTPVAQLGPIVSSDLGPKLRLQTEVAALNAGAGIDLASGIVIRNGNKSITLNFAGAATVQDVLNAINASGMGVKAEINADQSGINITNLHAGSRLTIGENGGTTAEDLGIRTFRTVTRLADLNEGRGVQTGTGIDFRITAANGADFGVDIDGAVTVQDVIDRINAAAAAAGVAVTASFATVGSGIVLADNTGGAGTFRVTRPGDDAHPEETAWNAAEDLGILMEAGPGVSRIVGDDVNPTKDESIFTYLIDLRDGLKNNDGRAIEIAARKIEDYRTELTKYHGKLGFMARGLETRKTQTEDAVLSTQALVSQIKDLDYTEAITRFQNLQMALQANLQTGGRILNISLLDYLR